MAGLAPLAAAIAIPIGASLVDQAGKAVGRGIQKGFVYGAGKVGGMFGKRGKSIGKNVAKTTLTDYSQYEGFKRGGKVARIKPYNNRPREFEGGGAVLGHKRMTRRQRENDSVRAILQPGEVVIPKKFYQKGKRPINLADRTVKALKKAGIRLPNT